MSGEDLNEMGLFEVADSASCLGSYFGNYDVDIYDEDIEALKSGKMLVHIDEYGFRVHYKPGKKPNSDTDVRGGD